MPGSIRNVLVATDVKSARRMQDETARVEEVLLEKSASDRLVRCFVQASGISFEEILDSYVAEPLLLWGHIAYS